MNSSNFYQQIYNLTAKIPRGRIMTYGQIARLLHRPTFSRIVGFALHVNQNPQSIPCHRVVNRLGKTAKNFAFDGSENQIALLKKEGISFKGDRVDLLKHLWRP